VNVLHTFLIQAILLLLEHQVPCSGLLQLQTNEASLTELDKLKQECQQLLEEQQLNQSQVCVSFLTNSLLLGYVVCNHRYSLLLQMFHVVWSVCLSLFST